MPEIEDCLKNDITWKKLEKFTWYNGNFTFQHELFLAENHPENSKSQRHPTIIQELDKDFTIQDTREAICYPLKYHKATGPDGIAKDILK